MGRTCARTALTRPARDLLWTITLSRCEDTDYTSVANRYRQRRPVGEHTHTQALPRTTHTQIRLVVVVPESFRRDCQLCVAVAATTDFHGDRTGSYVTETRIGTKPVSVGARFRHHVGETCAAAKSAVARIDERRLVLVSASAFGRLPAENWTPARPLAELCR